MAQDLHELLRASRQQRRFADALHEYLCELRQIQPIPETYQADIESAHASPALEPREYLCPNCRQAMQVMQWPNGYESVECRNEACPRWRVTLSWEEHGSLTPRQLAAYHVVNKEQRVAVEHRTEEDTNYLIA